jgi:hypothetical protein
MAGEFRDLPDQRPRDPRIPIFVDVLHSKALVRGVVAGKGLPPLNKNVRLE